MSNPQQSYQQEIVFEQIPISNFTEQPKNRRQSVHLPNQHLNIFQQNPQLKANTIRLTPISEPKIKLQNFQLKIRNQSNKEKKNRLQPIHQSNKPNAQKKRKNSEDFQYQLFKKFQKFPQPSALPKQYRLKIIQNKQNTRNLTILDISRRKNERMLNPIDLTELMNADLTNLKQFSIKKNNIGDQGIQILVRKELKNLQKIQLNNNNITIRGLKCILKNKWKENVDVNLSSIRKQKENEYFIGVGKYIPALKRLTTTKPQKVLDQMQRSYELYKGQSFHIVDLLFAIQKKQISTKILEQSRNIYKKIEQVYNQSIKTNKISLQVAVETLKRHYLSGLNVTFCKESTVMSQLSCAIIFAGMLNQRIKFKHKISDFETEWTFDKVVNDDQELQKYVSWYKKYIAKQFNLEQDQSIIFHSISKGSIINQISSNCGQDILNCSKPIKIIPLFEELKLSLDDFDAAGNYRFPAIADAQTQTRGGLPYYQPVLGQRYGINVKNRYDNGLNDWLQIKQNPGQWAVGFHGVKSPRQSLKKIMHDNTNDQGLKIPYLKAGGRQIHCYRDTINIKNEKVGSGVYLSPNFTECLKDYAYDTQCKNQNQKYRLIIQCRLNPKKIRISSSNQQYWVVKQSVDIRPYGIILFTQEQYQQILNFKAPIHKKFKWLQHKAKFQQFHGIKPTDDKN